MKDQNTQQPELKKSDMKKSLKDAPQTEDVSINDLLKLQMIKLLSESSTQKPSVTLGKGWLWIYRTIATHVLILLLGISGGAWWIHSNDLWSDYVQIGCNPPISSYTDMRPFYPMPMSLSTDATYKDLFHQQLDFNESLIVLMTEMNRDRFVIRKICEK
jgi:hypothetical protein